MKYLKTHVKRAYLGGKKMKKVFLASIILCIMLATAFQVNAVEVQNQKKVNGERTDTYKLVVYVVDWD